MRDDHGSELQPAGALEAGAALVEYVFLAALIAIVSLLAVQYFGGEVSDTMSTAGSHVQSARS